MIVGYGDKRTREFGEGRRVKAFSGFEHKAEMKLDRLDAATSLRDLDTPGNHLEALKGDRKGQYSIRINDQWRICFEWPKESPGPINVEIVDYHEVNYGKKRDTSRGAPGGRIGRDDHECGGTGPPDPGSD